MKYANKLTDKELRELYRMFTDTGAKIIDLTITKFIDSITLDGVIQIPDNEFEGEYLTIDDDYEINDFYVTVFDHSGNCTFDYRRYMYNKFGNEYATDYLFGGIQ